MMVAAPQKLIPMIDEFASLTVCEVTSEKFPACKLILGLERGELHERTV